MIDTAVLLAAAAVAYGLARWLQLPPIPFLLVGGVLLRIFELLPEREMLEGMLQLGLTFLVFAAGLELNPRRVAGQRDAALRVGLAQFVILGAAGFVAVSLLGYGARTAIYLSLALAASSTLLVVRLLQQRKQMFEPFGRLVLGVLLLQDLLVIVLLPVLAGVPGGALPALQGLAGSLVLVLATFASIRWLAPFLILRLRLDDEGLLLVTLALLFVFIGAALALGLPMIAGAFLAGVALSPFPVSGIVRGQLSSLSDFFLAIFFTALGGLVAVPGQRELLLALVLTGMVVLLTPPLVTFVAERAGLSARVSIESGLLLAQTSEFSLVVVLQGWAVGHLDEATVSVVVLVTIVTMFLTPLIATNRMTWRLMTYHPVRRKAQLAELPRDHVLLLGCGDNGMPLLETLMTAGHRVVVVDDDAAVIEALREGDVPSIRGDGADFDVLSRAGAGNARVIISTMRRARDSLHVLNWVRGLGIPVLVRVFDNEDAEQIRQRGGIPISYSEAATDDFVSWFEEARTLGFARERRRRSRQHPA